MKLGEIYTNRFNHYDSKIINIGMKEITLEALNSGVIDYVKLAYFNTNWIKLPSIEDYKTFIRDCFKGYKVFTEAKKAYNTILVMTANGCVEFSITKGVFVVTFSDRIQQQLGVDESLAFDIPEAHDAIELVASLITD